jgi:outer membrane protein W
MMRRLVIVLVAGLLVGFSAQPAHAQAKQGDSEVLIAGNLFVLTANSLNSTNGQFQFGYGYFVTDRFEVNVSPVVTVSSTTTTTPPTIDPRTGRILTTGSTTTSVDGDLGLGTAVQYFFGAKTSKVKPYVGGSLIIQSFKTRDQIDPVTFRTTSGSLADNLFAGGNFGVKNYFTDRAALDFKVAFGVQPSHAADFQLMQVTVGITYLF